MADYPVGFRPAKGAGVLKGVFFEHTKADGSYTAGGVPVTVSGLKKVYRAVISSDKFVVKGDAYSGNVFKAKLYWTVASGVAFGEVASNLILSGTVYEGIALGE